MWAAHNFCYIGRRYNVNSKAFYYFHITHNEEITKVNPNTKKRQEIENKQSYIDNESKKKNNC